MPNPTPQAAKGLQRWIEVFRSGVHVDSKGREAAFTNADLDQMVVNVAQHKPPAVLGHPQHNDPAYGWANLKREGDSLFAKFEDVNKDFEAGVDSGAYRNRSVRVVKDAARGWFIDHIGWLGATRPAITGLQPLSYSASDAAEAYEFSAELDPWTVASALDDTAASLRGVRDNLIAKDGVDAADAAIPDWRITSITAAAARIRLADADPNPFTAPAGAQTMLTQEDLDRTVRETEARVRAEFAATEATRAAEFTAATDLANRLQAERRTERIATTITGWKTAGQLLPAEEAGLAEFMAALEGGTATAFEFTAAGAAAGAARASKTPSQFFADFVAARGVLVKLGKTGGAGGDDPGPGLDVNNPQAIARAAQDFQAAEAKAGREISIAEAVGYVTRNPAAKA